jgi:hypothetical protein
MNEDKHLHELWDFSLCQWLGLVMADHKYAYHYVLFVINLD